MATPPAMEPAPLNYEMSWHLLRQSMYCEKIFRFDGVKHIAGYHRQIHSLCHELATQGINVKISGIYWRDKENRYVIEYWSKTMEKIPLYLIKRFNLQVLETCKKCGGELEPEMTKKTFGNGRSRRVLICWVCNLSEYLMRTEKPKPEPFSVENWVEIIGKGKQKVNE